MTNNSGQRFCCKPPVQILLNHQLTKYSDDKTETHKINCVAEWYKRLSSKAKRYLRFVA